MNWQKYIKGKNIFLATLHPLLESGTVEQSLWTKIASMCQKSHSLFLNSP